MILYPNAPVKIHLTSWESERYYDGKEYLVGLYLGLSIDYAPCVALLRDNKIESVGFDSISSIELYQPT